MLFRDIPGQEEIKSILKKTVKDSRISHALMFYGPEGSGKLALALALAQYISCTDRQEEACGVCPSCIKYSRLVHPDLHFVYPSNTTEKKEESSTENISEKWREALLENPYLDQHKWYEIIGIENKQGLISTKESNEIIRKLSLKSYESDYKILIMWLPERMNPPAANKLLKIIEEPPPDTIFLLVSDNVVEVLPTIQSRTQMIKVPRLKDEDIRYALKEKFSLDDRSAEDAVRLSNGNYNRALSAVQADEINLFNFNQFVSLMRICYSADVPELIEWGDEMARTGRERQKLFLFYGIRMLRENFLVSTDNHSISRMAEYEREWSVKFSPFISRENINELYEEFNNSYNQISANAYARIIFLDMGLKIARLIRKSG